MFFNQLTRDVGIGDAGGGTCSSRFGRSVHPISIGVGGHITPTKLHPPPTIFRNAAIPATYSIPRIFLKSHLDANFLRARIKRDNRILKNIPNHFSGANRLATESFLRQQYFLATLNQTDKLITIKKS